MQIKHLVYLVCGLLASFMGRSIAAHGGGGPVMWAILLLAVGTVFVMLVLDIRALVQYGPNGKPPTAKANLKHHGGRHPSSVKTQ